MKRTFSEYIKSLSDSELYKLAAIIKDESDKRISKEISLTERQIDVIKLLCFNNKEIGKRLYISDTTVDTHIRNILKNLCAASKTEALIKSLKIGVIKIHEVELPICQKQSQ